jgi:hypothetical protein
MVNGLLRQQINPVQTSTHQPTNPYGFTVVILSLADFSITPNLPGILTANLSPSGPVQIAAPTFFRPGGSIPKRTYTSNNGFAAIYLHLI